VPKKTTKARNSVPTTLTISPISFQFYIETIKIEEKLDRKIFQ